MSALLVVITLVSMFLSYAIGNYIGRIGLLAILVLVVAGSLTGKTHSVDVV
jgi:hypothetical protein